MADHIDGLDTVIGCRYREEDGTPSCIAGNVFARLGMLDRITEPYNNEPVFSFFAEDMDLFPEFTPEASAVIERAQVAADSGKTWGEALEAAR